MFVRMSTACVFKGFSGQNCLSYGGTGCLMLYKIAVITVLEKKTCRIVSHFLTDRFS